MSKRILRYDHDTHEVVEVTDQRPKAVSSIPQMTRTYGESKPLVSQGLGCMRHQVPEMREEVKKHGLTSVHIREDGAAEITSRGDTGRRGLLALRGMRDNDGGYGDG